MFGRLFHWGPLTALTIIKWISLATLYCNTMWFPPADSIPGFMYTAVFLVFSGLTFYHFFMAMFDGPGYLPPGWAPHQASEDELNQLQYCELCQGYKAPRAHHCRKCGRCVLKMDHHCPWINNCVGHYNHGHFTAFLGSAVCGCIISTITLSCSLYYGLNRNWYEYYGTGKEPRVILTLWTLLASLLGLGLSIGVVIAVGLLLYFQLRSIVRNQTGIEDWIIEKANYRHRHSDVKFVYPYNLGRVENMKQVLTFTCSPKGDGLTWEVVEGTDQYTLTREQLCQKAEKKDRSREYEIFNNYSGAWFPIMQGFSVCCRPPCTDEPRIKLQRGDKVKVTRWKKHWLYGDKIVFKGEARVRGWFPRQIAVEISDTGLQESAYCQLKPTHSNKAKTGPAKDLKNKELKMDSKERKKKK